MTTKSQKRLTADNGLVGSDMAKVVWCSRMGQGTSANGSLASPMATVDLNWLMASSMRGCLLWVGHMALVNPSIEKETLMWGNLPLTVSMVLVRQKVPRAIITREHLWKASRLALVQKSGKMGLRTRVSGWIITSMGSDTI